MLAVTAVLPDAGAARSAPAGRPIVLVHGAANSAGVWASWQALLAERGWPSYAIDLRGHGGSSSVDLSRVSMRDYADDVRSLVGQLAGPVVMGWSMGGLVAMMVAAGGGTAACVALAPSAPASGERDGAVELRAGVFGPEVYGITSRDPEDQPAMPDLNREERETALASLCDESLYAKDERAAGVVVDAMPCPLLVVTGSADGQWPRSRYEGMALQAEFVEIEGASHWGLVLSKRALGEAVPSVLGWLEGAL